MAEMMLSPTTGPNHVMTGPAFHRNEGTRPNPSIAWFPGIHAALLDTVAESLSMLKPSDCRASSDNQRVTCAALHLRKCLAAYQSLLDGLASRRISYQHEHTAIVDENREDTINHILTLHQRMVREAAHLPPCTRLFVRHGNEWMESSVARESAYLQEYVTQHCLMASTMMNSLTNRLQRLCESDPSISTDNDQMAC